MLDEEGAGSGQGAIYEYQGKPLLKEAVWQFPAVTSRIRREKRKRPEAADSLRGRMSI
jgi:hypothetical protein